MTEICVESGADVLGWLNDARHITAQPREAVLVNGQPTRGRGANIIRSESR